MASDSIGEGSCNGSHASDSHKEDSIEHRCLDPDIGDLACAGSKETLFLGRFAIERDQKSAGNIKALGHSARHRCVEIESLTGEGLDTFSHPFSRQEKKRKEQQGNKCDLPRKDKHCCYHENERYDVAHHPGESAGKRLLRPHDVGINSRNQCARLCSGKECDGLSLHVSKDLGTKIVNETFTNSSRVPTTDNVKECINNR